MSWFLLNVLWFACDAREGSTQRQGASFTGNVRGRIWREKCCGRDNSVDQPRKEAPCTSARGGVKAFVGLLRGGEENVVLQWEVT